MQADFPIFLPRKWQPLFDQKFRTGLYSEIFQKDKIPYLIKKIGMSGYK